MTDTGQTLTEIAAILHDLPQTVLEDLLATTEALRTKYEFPELIGIDTDD